MKAWLATTALLWLLAAAASAQSEASAPTPGEATLAADPAVGAPVASAEPPAESSFSSVMSALGTRVQIHGFVSQGGFVTTDNEYIGQSSRGSLKFFEAALNVSVLMTDQLRVGMQFVSRSVGVLSEEVPRLDWGFLDYRWLSWLGVRAGVIKLPLGLYNEYVAVDAARNAILLPQSMYPLRNRDALVSHLGFGLYGDVALGRVGALDYQAWLGGLSVPRSALRLSGAELDSVDTKYVAGGQLFWRPPVEGLRMGGTYLHAVIDFNLTLAPETTSQLVMAGLVPADYDGRLVVSQAPTSFWVASGEYIRGSWLVAAEYSRWRKHQKTTLPQVLPAFDEDAERFYAMLTYRISPLFELGSYFSVIHADVDDRRGRSAEFAKNFVAYQRDLAATLRLDVNEYWLWKVEGHFMDGAADLDPADNPSPKRRWGLFLLRTTATF
jgi:hypothetical protein